MKLSEIKSYYFTYKGREYIVMKYTNSWSNLCYSYYSKTNGPGSSYGRSNAWCPRGNHPLYHSRYGKPVKCRVKALKLFHDAAEAMDIIKHGTVPGTMSAILGFKVREAGSPIPTVVPPFKVKYAK